jgi:hypothetical protein
MNTNLKDLRPLSVLKCLIDDDITSFISHYEVIFKDIDFGYSAKDETRMREVIDNVKNGWSLTRSFGKHYNSDSSKRLRQHPFYKLIMRFSQRLKHLKSRRVETNQLLRMRFK